MGDGPALALHAVVFIAAIFQTATGIGFALIAGPFLLIFLQDGSAVQISILLNLLMSAALAPGMIKHVHWQSLRSLSIGLACGLPLGIAFFLLADLTMLKLGAALFIGLALLPFLRTPSPHQSHGGSMAGMASGLVAGVMTGFAAMPGPAASFYLSGLQNLPRDVVRSTIYALFILAYGAALALHLVLTGVAAQTVATGLWLAPASAAGMLAGIPLGRRLSQRQFRLAVAITLLATAIALVAATLA